MMIKIYVQILLVVTMSIASFVVAPVSFAALELVKSSSASTVYFIDTNGIRHPFPNEITYQSWYGRDFSLITTLNDEALATLPMGKNITIRPGTYTLKIASSPEIFAIETGGVLREITEPRLAVEWYGEGWRNRLVEIPEIFFDDYVFGDPLGRSADVVNGTVFRTSGDPAKAVYYFKNKNVVRPFASVAAMNANRINQSWIVTASIDSSVRERPITGFDPAVFNPIASAWSDQRDCENTHLKAATIFLTSTPHTAQQAKKIEALKRAITDRYYWATETLSEIDMSYPTVIMNDDQYMTFERKRERVIDIKPEVLQSFFDAHPDDFDFVFVWTDKDVMFYEQDEAAQYTAITNAWRGNGRSEMNKGAIYGSAGRLKGMIVMGNLKNYDVDSAAGLSKAANTGTHEIGHHWLSFVGFTDETGALSKTLLNDGQDHWSHFVTFTSPMAASGWIDNGDGTFTSTLSRVSDRFARKFSVYDLYFMGLIPHQLMPAIKYVEPVSPEAAGPVIAGTLKEVGMDQIFRANGKMRCVIM